MTNTGVNTEEVGVGQVVEEVVWERELTPYSDKDPENPTLPQGTCVYY